MNDRLYLLDTNILSDLIKNPSGKAVQRIAAVGEETLCTSVMVASELRYGAAKKGSQAILKKVEAILNEYKFYLIRFQRMPLMALSEPSLRLPVGRLGQTTCS